MRIQNQNFLFQVLKSFFRHFENVTKIALGAWFQNIIPIEIAIEKLARNSIYSCVEYGIVFTMATVFLRALSDRQPLFS